MQIERSIMSDLLAWKSRSGHLPLLLRGARQVGKTSVVRQLGQLHYEHYVELNLEDQPEAEQCFNQFNPQQIINLIAILTGQEIIPGKTLLFIDEIQECPRAIQSLRYFKEKLPELDVIGAGSLLEFALEAEDFKMPVGRVEFLYMQPVSFYEYLVAVGAKSLRAEIESATCQKPLPELLHQKALQSIREYFVLGGMPAVISNYIQTGSFSDAQHIQHQLWATYRADFSKYARQSHLPALKIILDKMPNLLSQQVKYSKIDPELRSIQLKNAILLLSQAGVLNCVYASAASHIPLNAQLNYKKYKLLFLDIGLICSRSELSSKVLLEPDMLLAHQGALAEQFVGQELLAYQSNNQEPHLYYWMREALGSQAEIDFVLQSNNGAVLPIEVKSGVVGKLKSLHIFMKEKQSKLGVKISQQPLGLEKNILSIPLYMIFKWPELVEEAFQSN